MEDTLVLLVGASGSGKTSVAKELEKIGYNVIQSYTTRQPRYEGEWGHTFINNPFISYDNKNEINYIQEGLNPNGKSYWRKNMIAYFNSYNSGHHYFATDEQVIRGKTNIYIVDSKGAEMVHEFYKDSDVEVITVYLQVDEQERRNRMINRAIPTLTRFRSGKTYSYQTLLKEVSSRLESDKLLFQVVKCDYVVDGNQSLESVVNMVRSIIEQEVL